MPPRPIWKGHLKISLVSFAVRLHGATDTTERISFNYLHRGCGQRLKQQLVCPVHGEVARADMVKGYEYEEDRYVVVEPDELKQLEAKTSKTIEIDQFIEGNELATIYLDRPYYLGPDGKLSEQGYQVIHEAMKRTGRVGIGRVVMHGAEQFVALQLEGNGLRLTTMRSAPEIRKPEPYFEDVPAGKPPAEQVKLAEGLINSITAPLDVSELRDRYQEAVRALVQSKIEGGAEPVVAPEEEVPATFSFLEALKASVGQTEGKPTRSRKKKPPARSIEPAATRKRRKKA